jgi:hypothetical protein
MRTIKPKINLYQKETLIKNTKAACRVNRTIGRQQDRSNERSPLKGEDSGSQSKLNN